MFSQQESSFTIFCWDALSFKERSIIRSWHKIDNARSTSRRRFIAPSTLKPLIYWPRCWKRTRKEGSRQRKPSTILSLLERWILSLTIIASSRNWPILVSMQPRCSLLLLLLLPVERKRGPRSVNQLRKLQRCMYELEEFLDFSYFNLTSKFFIKWV